jgi:hypothetical protein
MCGSSSSAVAICSSVVQVRAGPTSLLSNTLEGRRHVVRVHGLAVITATILACGCAQDRKDEFVTDATVTASLRQQGLPRGEPAPSVLPGAPAPAREESRESSEAMAKKVEAAAASAHLASASAIQVVDPARMQIRSGVAAMQVDSLEPGLSSLRSLVSQVGGRIANVSIQAGAERSRQAMIDIRMPPAQFDVLVDRLKSLGNVESVEVSSVDVGEEYVDVAARQANARRLEERLIQLLANRTGRLSDVLAVERELARVREEIDRLDGRLRYLRTRVAESSLSVTMHESLPVIIQPGQNPLRDAIWQAGRNFVALLAGFIAALGFLVPLAIVSTGAYLGWRRFGPSQQLKGGA